MLPTSSGGLDDVISTVADTPLRGPSTMVRLKRGVMESTSHSVLDTSLPGQKTSCPVKAPRSIEPFFISRVWLLTEEVLLF